MGSSVITSLGQSGPGSSSEEGLTENSSFRAIVPQPNAV